MRSHHRLSIAPMMSYTDRHYRYMMRLFTQKSLLYTEMVVGSTITHNLNNNLDRFLGFDPVEHPVAIQLGGDEPEVLKTASRVCEDFGYDEINLNVGCPSDRVQKGRFGACLMKEPERVAEVLSAMRAAVAIPVTVKHRIGVDDQDSYQDLARFVEVVSQAGTVNFSVHARKAWLKGLSPAQNRSVPPLKYDFVYQLKKDFPHLEIIVNGGVNDLEETLAHLQHLDGVMIGRAAYNQPELFAEADQRIFGEAPSPKLSPLEIVERMDAYIHRQLERGHKFSFLTKHLVGLFKNRPHSRKWRQTMSKLVQTKPKHFSLPDIYKQIFNGQVG